MSSTTKKPRAAPRDRSGPAQPTAKGQARSAAVSKGNATRSNPWTRVQDAKLLKAWREDKTDQALADAVGCGRSAEECQDRLHGKGGLVPKRLFIAYEWNASKPREHSEVFRAALTEKQRKMSAPQLEKLWKEESLETCLKAVKSVVNCGLDAGWTSKPKCAEILGLMGLHPDFLQQRLKRRLTEGFTDRKKALFGTADATRRHRDHCLKTLASEKQVSLEDLNDDDFEKRDQRAYNHLRSKACCADAISDGANEETQMPTWPETSEIARRTISPPFEPVPVGAGLANPAFARQFRRHAQSFDLYAGRSGCTCPKRAPPTRPERPESSVRHYVASICKHRPVLRHLLLPLFAQGRPRARRALQEAALSAVHQRRLSRL